MGGGVETPEVGVEVAGDEFEVGSVAEGEEAPSTGKGNRTVVERDIDDVALRRIAGSRRRGDCRCSRG